MKGGEYGRRSGRLRSGGQPSWPTSHQLSNNVTCTVCTRIIALASSQHRIQVPTPHFNVMHQQLQETRENNPHLVTANEPGYYIVISPGERHFLTLYPCQAGRYLLPHHPTG